MNTGPLTLAVLFAVICTGAGVVAFFITLAHVGRTRVVLYRDKWQLVASIILAVIGAVILLFLILGLPTQSWGQEAGPPKGWIRATVSTCSPYNPSSCQSRTVWLEERSWCGRRASWWSPTTSREIVTVRCGQ